MEKLFRFSSSIVVVIVVFGFSIGIAQAGPCGLPDFASADFSNPLIINNPYFPLVPGTTFRYEPVPNDENVVNTVEVTNMTKTITVNGKSIDCREVYDVEKVDEVKTEETYDWYAQDDDGNVWYCGEATTVFLPGGGLDTTGSWEAGIDGALPGYVMLADSNQKSGECYQQESLPGVAEDMAKIMRLNAKVDLENGDFYEGCLETKEWSPLERGAIEQKIYAEGVGLVLNFEHHGKRVRNELISVNP